MSDAGDRLGQKGNVVRRAAFIVSALMVVTCGLTVVAGAARAVDDKTTCAAFNEAWTDLNDRLAALGGPGSFSELRQIYLETAADLRVVADAADPGAVKDGLNTAVAQLSRLETATNLDDFYRVMGDPTLTAALDAAGTPCGL
ncbi:hypothetical protein LTV02_11935 [Nocardia yamanashiensis]|uniref:hypothetical protein n=1 Tax=Nocardia yamanashiensis TaxID=209247 RepID=UPI001E450E70|nr:hypothetical protein [Nocardia yamanashiensis]UGT44042.1 hypothetical protein LTV02_11935 [Nocardia yamanashiensis]